MTTITPIGRRQQQRVIAETLEYIQQAAAIFEHPFQPIDILFDLKGQASGMFCVHGEHTHIRYNPYIFAKHSRYSSENTVPHEVAHYIMYCLHGTAGVRPHGDEWKQLMLRFGVEPRRTNKLDLEGIPVRRQRRHPYNCSCTSHQISSRRHNQIRKGKARYYCRSCKGELVTNPQRGSG